MEEQSKKDVEVRKVIKIGSEWWLKRPMHQFRSIAFVYDSLCLTKIYTEENRNEIHILQDDGKLQYVFLAM